MKFKVTKSKKTKWILGSLLVLFVAGGCLAYYFGIPGLENGEKIYVEEVSVITGLGSGNGGQNRYAGVVESQEVWNIEQNVDKTVKEIYVEEGDSVKVGDKLFAYDNDEAKLNLAQAELELERMENEVKAGEEEIKNLEKEKKSAAKSDQIEYTIQIQSQKATNKKTEFEIKSQKAKIESLKKATKNSVVKSEMAGVVQKINETAISDDVDTEAYTEGDDTIFMSILATGDYRIKASVNEQNQWTIEEGKSVIVRSRVDENVKWTGKITNLDTENPQSSSENEYSDSDDIKVSSEYPFYVDLDSSEGLILGQHVYIEPDDGQDKEKEGIWLDSYYLLQEEDESWYVWAENMANHLEKRVVTVGMYDEELDKYEILTGLTLDDYIAFPEEDLKAGMRTTRDIEEADEGLDDMSDTEDVGEDMDMEEDRDDEDTFQEFEGEDAIFDEEDAGHEEEFFDEEGAVGSIEQSWEVLL